jgi:hypothetical protein
MRFIGAKWNSRFHQGIRPSQELHEKTSFIHCLQKVRAELNATGLGMSELFRREGPRYVVSLVR